MLQSKDQLSAVEADVTEFRISETCIKLHSDPGVFFPTDFARNMGLVLQGKLGTNNTVCELGLGSGVLAILAGSTGARVVGLDKNPQALSLSERNWLLNGLPMEFADFRKSDLFSAISETEHGQFDVVWSNPPLLPELVDQPDESEDRESFEVSGPHGRLVLDTMLSESKKLLKPGGKMYTIATSLQGWNRTQDLLNDSWENWSVVKEVDLELTYECGPMYIEWWKNRQSETGEQYLFESDGKLTHKLWFVEGTREE